MRVSTNIQNNRLYNYSGNRGLVNNSGSEVSFEGKKLATLSSCVVPFPLIKLKRFDINEYNKLNSVDKALLRFQYKCLIPPFNKDFYKDVEIIHDQVSNFMKQSFDKKYGEGKYVVISIGRSLSSITKVLGYKIGENNVKNIPLSNTPRFNKIGALDNLSEDSILKFQNYLYKNGLGKEDIKNSGKSYILTDFCATGQSLFGAENLFKSERMFGEKSDIFAEDVNSTIPDRNFDFKLKLRAHFLESRFKPYSFVKKCENIEDCESRTRKSSRAPFDVKLVWFKLLDNVMKGKETKLSDLSEHAFYY